MKVETSITLSKRTMDALDEMKSAGLSRSRIVEVAIAELLERHRKRKREEADRGILDRRAEALNAETEDLLAYQVDLQDVDP